ncbi:hypothetical protein SEUCBS139899_009875 [Sporothrix eucalyptigena]
MRKAIPDHLFLMRQRVPPQTYSYNHFYGWWEQYPDGVADVVAYWAETRIFGGVLNFDHGESDLECDGVYLYSDRAMGGATLFLLTEQQFKTLKDFLSSSLSSPPSYQELPSSLPILGSNQNRWCWSVDVTTSTATAAPSAPTPLMSKRLSPTKQLRWRGSDFPEKQDKQVVLNTFMARQRGEPVDGKALRVAEDNINYRTMPVSPAWKPHYFFHA